jgi:VWFA-related protein
MSRKTKAGLSIATGVFAAAIFAAGNIGTVKKVLGGDLAQFGDTFIAGPTGIRAPERNDPLQIQISPPQHESTVVNIEVPVRVLKKGVFVDGLTLADFEVFENGVRQTIEAVYLIKDKKVLREESAGGAALPPPQNIRHYVLSLDLKEYLPKIGDALDFFFTDVLGPEDTLVVITPAKTYRFKPEALSRLPRQQIADQLKSKLKTDIQLGNSQYRTLMRDFYHLEEEEYPADLAEVKENMLFELAKQMRDLTEVTESQVMRFADALKSQQGEKHVFLVYQKDVLPEHEFAEDRQMELFKPVDFDVEKIKWHLADASITIHCLYITKTPGFALNPAGRIRSNPAARPQDLSSDIFASFKEMAAATGGLTESTANPNFALRQAAEASSHYYLLYYRPLNYRADGRFQKIEIKVKGEGLNVSHRLGYIAD